MKGREFSKLRFVGAMATIFLSMAISSAFLAAQVDHTAGPDLQLAHSNSGEKTESAGRSRIRIGPGDLIEMTVFDVPELTQQIRVSDQGIAVTALLGPLHLGGMSPAEAQIVIDNRLRDGNYLLDPHTSIMIKEYGTQGVSVFGEVTKPGVYTVLGTRNLLDVISEAGGITRVAAPSAIIKHRTGDATLEVSLSNKPGDLLATNVELQPGDTVIVPKAGIVYVIGDVGRPGGFIMENSGSMTLLQAVALAAGTNRTAVQSRTRIIHKTDSGFHDVTVDLKQLLDGKIPDVALSAEDIVYVPSSKLKLLFDKMPASALASSAASSAVYLGIIH
jgi:polysaccharide biosynthesis/export protein